MYTTEIIIKFSKGQKRMHQSCKKDMSVSRDYLTCPFCENLRIRAEPGKARCSVCSATFEIDDRAECIFGDTSKIRLPAIGTICASCGLIQAGENQNCLYCGAGINTSLQ